MNMIYPVILSGGSGTRLWPLSRAMYPKQFIRFFGDQADSLLEATLRRLPAGHGIAQPIVVTNNDHRFLVQEAVERVRMKPGAIILEPEARNTAPALAVAALHVATHDPDGVLVVAPSDHAIGDQAKFLAAVLEAAEIASKGRLVLFGIQPISPHTGYGYIKRGADLDGSKGAFLVDSFVEKPDAQTAAKYLASGTYFWNSGIFVLHVATFLAEMEHLCPEILAAAREALAGAVEDLGFLRLGAVGFAKAPSISIDYAVMEKARAIAMLPLDVGWNDVGSWSALWDIAPHDGRGNAVSGDAILEATENTYVHSTRGVVATIGVKDLVIVDTPDALLIADRGRTQDVGAIVRRLKADGRREHEQHVRSVRPWGYFETLAISSRFQVKKLHVAPGGKLSLQMHHHRSEHWVVVQGTAKVTVGEIEKLVRENESVYIVATQWHRLENPGKVPLELIEVQIGTYLGEDDIIRSDDVYRRSPSETK